MSVTQVNSISCYEELREQLLQQKRDARIFIMGPTGTGKSTLGNRLGVDLDSTHRSLDELYWGPDWIPLPEEEFMTNLSNVLEQDRWILDGNYNQVQPLIFPHATCLIWLNYRFWTNFNQLLKRTVRRIRTQEKLYADNRESYRKAFFSRDSILLWLWTSYPKLQARYRPIFDTPEQYADQLLIELKEPAQARNR
ncbi:MAG: hypothetical protein R3C11_27975 [Planctomycetaceae bacterium]